MSYLTSLCFLVRKIGLIIAPASDSWRDNKTTRNNEQGPPHAKNCRSIGYDYCYDRYMIVITDKELRPRAVKTVAEVTQPVWTGAAAGSKSQRLSCLALYRQLGVGGPFAATVLVPCRLPRRDREWPVLPAPQAGLDLSPSYCPQSILYSLSPACRAGLTAGGLGSGPSHTLSSAVSARGYLRAPGPGQSCGFLSHLGEPGGLLVLLSLSPSQKNDRFD